MNKIFAVCMLPLVVLAGCGGGGGGGNETPVSPLKINNVEYEVVGLGGANKARLTYQNGFSLTQTTVALPFTYKLLFPADGDFLYISAQNDSTGGYVSVLIKVEGQAVATGISSGAFGIATASKTCCK